MSLVDLSGVEEANRPARFIDFLTLASLLEWDWTIVCATDRISLKNGAQEVV
jgi:hypothetical protein